MAVARSLATFRERSRVTSRAVIRGGQIEVTDRTIQERTAPSGTVTSSFRVENTAFFLSAGPDRCDPPNVLIPTPATQVRGTVYLEGQNQDEEVLCVPYAGTVTVGNTKQMDLTFRAPNTPGSYTVRYDFELAGTDTAIGTFPGLLTVEQGYEPPPGDDPPTGGCSLIDLIFDPACGVEDVVGAPLLFLGGGAFFLFLLLALMTR